MAGSAPRNAARMQGDDYQSRWFFIQALRMFDFATPALRVGLEQGQFPWFDDVVTHYRPGSRSVRRAADAHQIKFHVVADGALSFPNLILPDFMNSPTTSLLSRIVQANRANPDADFVLMSPWSIQHDDLLGKMAETGTDGSLRLPLLFDGKKRSKAAKIRSSLTKHAGIDESELRAALDHFRVEVTPSLPRLQGMLDDKLARHGFKPVGEERLANPYDDLVRKLIIHGARDFDKDGFTALMRDEHLLIDEVVKVAPRRVGIRSFIRFAEYLDEFTTLLDLLDKFEHRHLKASSTWSDIGERVAAFMNAIDGDQSEQVEMHLSCHISIAYAAGRAVSPKSGTRYSVHQTGQGGTRAWDLSERAPGSASDLWSVDEVRIREDAPDIAVAVDLTRAIGIDVTHYVRASVPSVGRLLVFTPRGGPSQTAVRDGLHAAALAESFDQLMHEQQTKEERSATVHLFASAPNGFTFALGRASQHLARVSLYEYDFERGYPLGYSPSIFVATR